MTKQSKKVISITPVRKATEEELEGIKVPQKGEPYVQTVIGVTQLPEPGGKAMAWFPTHDFEVIKKHREHLYYTGFQLRFLNERRIKRLLTTSKDMEDDRRSWLEDELGLIEELMNNPQITRSDKHELRKYRTAVTDELEGKGKITAPADKTVPEKKEPTKREKQIGYQYFAFYQIITENTPSMEAIRMPENSASDKKEFARRIFQELRGDTIFNGDSFYVEYQRLKGLYDKKMLLHEANDPKNPQAKRRFKEYTFRIAEYFGNEEYKRWWGRTITQ